jgi:predicted acetyltransferase
MLSCCLLIRPAAPFRKSYIEALEEGLDFSQGPSADAEKIRRIDADFAAHLNSLDRDGQSGVRMNGHELPGVPGNTFWLVDGAEFIGAVNIRARIDTRILAHFGGHVGYSIRPSRQGRGYGTHLLALALRLCRGMGLGLVRVSCAETNIASRRVIEKNGGLLLRRCENFPPFVERPYLLFEIPLF